MAEVLHVFRCIAHKLPMREVAEIEAVANRGLRGCAHAQPGGMRQVLLMDVETLELLGLRPGEIKENVTTRGFDVRALRPGMRLRIGQALLEVALPCNPCKRMEYIRLGLKNELRGRRGMLCRVLESGMVRTGDAIEVMEYERVGAQRE